VLLLCCMLLLCCAAYLLCAALAGQIAAMGVKDDANQQLQQHMAGWLLHVV
jgi:hypothetical protein